MLQLGFMWGVRVPGWDGLGAISGRKSEFEGHNTEFRSAPMGEFREILAHHVTSLHFTTPKFISAHVTPPHFTPLPKITNPNDKERQTSRRSEHLYLSVVMDPQSETGFRELLT